MNGGCGDVKSIHGRLWRKQMGGQNAACKIINFRSDMQFFNRT